MFGMEGEEGIDDDFMAEGDAGIRATIMGRNMFGPVQFLGGGARAVRADGAFLVRRVEGSHLI